MMNIDISKLLLYKKRILTIKPKRYRNLLKIIYGQRCKRIMEIGTCNGIHARQMIETASIFYPINKIEYHGFDLFEDDTKENLKKEFVETHKPPSHEEVKQRLQATGTIIHLYKGYTNNTLSEFLDKFDYNKQIDFIFIDGGHSIKTITSDWNYVKKIMSDKTTVIFDDYYSNEESEVRGMGCQLLIDKLDRNIYDVEILEPEDNFKKKWGVLRINMVKVKYKKPKPDHLCQKRMK